MNKIITESISEQYGAAFQMLSNIVSNCDEDLWNDSEREIIISQVVYHVCFFIDYYLCKSGEERDEFNKAPGKLGPDNLGERTDGMKWDKIYTREELLSYLDDLKVKAKQRFEGLKQGELAERSLYDWHGSSVLSSFMYNLRHIMLHVGALHVRLNTVSKEPQKWVSKSDL